MNNSRFMTLEELFNECGVRQRDREALMKRAEQLNGVLADRVEIRYRGAGWENVAEDERCPSRCAWNYISYRPRQFMFLKANRDKAIDILGLSDDGNEDWKLGATND